MFRSLSFPQLLPSGMCWNLSVDDQYLYLGYESGDLVVFDHRDHIRQVAESKIHQEIISAIATHHRTIYTSSPDGTLARSQMSESGELAALQQSTSLECKSVGVLRVRDDGRVYVAGGWDGGVRLYSCKKDRFLGVVEAHSPETITDIVLWGGNRVTTAGRDNKVAFWTFY